MSCLNLSNSNINKIAKEFGEIKTSKLLDAYFPDKIPTFEEFISNKNVRNELGIIPISKVRDEIGVSFPKEISNSQLINLKKAISKTNDKVKDTVYLLFNVVRKGQADLYTWSLRKVKGNLNIKAKLERAITSSNNSIQSNDKINDLQKKVNSQSIQGNIFQNIQGEYNDTVSPFEKMTKEQQVVFEKTIRDLSARIADRIGIPYEIINDKSQKYKGKIENGIAYINLAYATLDSSLHEILAHPIIRAIKNNYKFIEFEPDEDTPFGGTLKQEDGYSQLYKNLLKELEYGKGAEVLDRIKRDYVSKGNVTITTEQNIGLGEIFTVYSNGKIIGEYTNELEANKIKLQEENKLKYTIEEQQEEAIVELVSLMAADKIKLTQDTKNLLSLLKQLWIEMSKFIKSLLNKKEVDITKDLDNIKQLSEDKLIEFMKKRLILEDCR